LKSNEIPLAEAIEASKKIVRLKNQSDDVGIFGTNVMQILNGWTIKGDG
jgi:hypothetical protein